MMWFKHCRVYELLEPFKETAATLSQALEGFAFTPCEAFESKRLGWSHPLPLESQGDLVYEQQGRLLMCLTLESKILPATVIHESLAQHLEQQEEKAGRRLSKRERTQLKSEVIDNLLPRAFSKHQKIYGYIDVRLGLLIINTSSATLAETFSIALRQALGSFKVRLQDVAMVAPMMTDWVSRHTFPQGFEVDDMCVIQDGLETGGFIRCQKQNLFAEDIQALLGPGREVIALRMVWQDKIRFVLKEDGSLQGVKFLEAVLKQAGESSASSQLEQLITDFSLMSESLTQLCNVLQKLFKPQSKQEQRSIQKQQVKALELSAE